MVYVVLPSNVTLRSASWKTTSVAVVISFSLSCVGCVVVIPLLYTDRISGQYPKAKKGKVSGIDLKPVLRYDKGMRRKQPKTPKQAKPKRKVGKDKMRSHRFADEIYDRWRKVAKRRKMSIAALIRERMEGIR